MGEADAAGVGVFVSGEAITTKRSRLFASDVIEPIRKNPVWVCVRIPWSKVHRAFPELDRFDDDKCLEFIQLACSKFWRSRMIVGVIGLTVCIATFVALLIGLNTLLDGVFYRTVAERLRSPYYLWLWAGGIAASGAFVGFSGLLIRDRWIRWAVASQIVAARCLNCEYSLLGLTPDAGFVLCPECGQQANLQERGITAEELLA